MKFIQKNNHSLLMAVGCIVMPIAVFALVTKISAGSWSYILLLLLCPAMHLLMHRGMHDHKNRKETSRAQLTAPELERRTEGDGQSH